MKKVLLGLALTLFIVVSVPVYWALEPSRQGAAVERQTLEAAERGAALYLKTCVVCHGSRGEGRIGPALKGTSLAEEAIRKTVSRGRAGTPMPAFDREEGGLLKSNEIHHLATFIKNWDDSLLEEAESH